MGKQRRERSEQVWEAVDGFARDRSETMKGLRRLLWGTGEPEVDKLQIQLRTQLLSVAQLPLYEAFCLYSGDDDAESFVYFLVALLLRGRSTFEHAAQDPGDMRQLGIPRRAHDEVEDLVLDLGLHPLESGVLEDVLERADDLVDERTSRINEVSLHGRNSLRPRRPALESKDGYEFNLRLNLFLEECGRRWPALRPADEGSGTVSD